MTLLATAALLLTVVALLSGVGVLFAPFLLGAFLLALVGVLGAQSDRRVRQREPAMDPCAWRGCD